MAMSFASAVYDALTCDYSAGKRDPTQQASNVLDLDGMRHAKDVERFIRALMAWRDAVQASRAKRRVPRAGARAEREGKSAGRERLCWRCRAVRVRVFGIPCPECRAAIDADYLEKRTANDGQLLYLPDDCAPAQILNAAGSGRESR